MTSTTQPTPRTVWGARPWKIAFIGALVASVVVGLLVAAQWYVLTGYVVGMSVGVVVTCLLAKRSARQPAVCADACGVTEAGVDPSRSVEALRRELADVRQSLVQAQRMASFGALGAGITHEVKNPITALVGFAQLAQKKIDNPTQVIELLRVIESEGLRCRDVLSSFLKFARGQDTGQHSIELNQVVEDTARILRHQLVVHGVQLGLRLASESTELVGNTIELQQLLVNLVLNAQQSMDGGGSVELQTVVVGNEVLLSVVDNGPGIPEELRASVFDPFFTTKSASGGTGLGLSVCRRIAEQHHGTLTLRSQVGEGTTFTLRLPKEVPATAAQAKPQTTSISASTGP